MKVVSDTMDLLRLPPAAEGQQIIVVGQRKSGGGGGCAQCDQKGGISMTGPHSNSTQQLHASSATYTENVWV